eukprot:gnl/MRDRNA2_/MRDRNA2_129245_c0_seq1.p1 gnl/MRDRNA2_/MRDRNA2_129245_c0~~gnl/MRDRNA2_/MRDRNA2_129245_c0_seq1.p1  ORF type:complete len:178 (-),score=46.82 gnl/MRDRNA2_/MRDRNA2_129245_c0_seq1:281-739(-)
MLSKKHPGIQQDIRDFDPEVPVAKMIEEVQKAANLIEKKLPWDKYGKGNTDTYAYNRVRSFVTSFGKTTSAHLKTIEASGKADKIEDFLHACIPVVTEVHEFADPRHNAVKTRIRTSFQKAAQKIGVTLQEDGSDSDSSEVHGSAPQLYLAH